MRQYLKDMRSKKGNLTTVKAAELSGMKQSTFGILFMHTFKHLLYCVGTIEYKPHRCQPVFFSAIVFKPLWAWGRLYFLL